MIFQCRNLSYTVPKRPLFTKLCADFPSGKLTGIIGPNGSGKTTLLSLLAGIKKPIEGQVLLYSRAEKKREIGSLSLKERARRIAYLPQNNRLHTDLTVLELVLLGRAPYQGLVFLQNKQDCELAMDCLEAVGLPYYSERLLWSLSAGEFQRVMLARLLASQTDILLLDEAVTALDIHYSLEFMELCRRLCRKKKTIVLVIHQLETAFRYCDYILMLGVQKNGSAHYLGGPTKEVMRPKNLDEVFRVKTKQNKDGLSFYPSGDRSLQKPGLF